MKSRARHGWLLVLMCCVVSYAGLANPVMAMENHADVLRDQYGRFLGGGSADAITPNDSADLSAVTRGLYVGTAGAVRVLLERDSVAVDFVGVAAGSVLPLRVKRVYATNTTASNLVALY